MHDQAILCCDAIHRERRILLKQEIGRMVLFFTDQPSLLAPNIQVLSNFSLFVTKKVYLTLIEANLIYFRSYIIAIIRNSKYVLKYTNCTTSLLMCMF